MSRIIIISNRLPVSISISGKEIELVPSAGGLATGLKSLKTKSEIIWVGWPGISISRKSIKKEVKERLNKLKMFPVFLTEDNINKYYEGFSNDTIWPLFHYFQQYSKYKNSWWRSYKKVNQKFVAKVAEIANEDDIFWVQDYHLLLAPQMLRNIFPKAKIGYFLHIPFPSFEIFRTLPWREEILNGMLGADLIGFHTYDYVRHFTSAVGRIVGVDNQLLGRLYMEKRVADIDCFPMGIDFNKYADTVFEEDTQLEIQRYRKTIGDQKIILSIDRLDYSKGLTMRLRAFDLYLKENPDKIGKVSMWIILVPSRDSVERYKELKEEIDKMVGALNGKYGVSDWYPIHYFYRSIRFKRLIAWYKIAPIALITPHRDGMNLVSKEYLATKHDNKGVLILSERAGSAKELLGAVQVNPSDIRSIVSGIEEAIEMSQEEQIRRNIPMREHLKRNTVNKWASNFLARLEKVSKYSQTLMEKQIDQKLTIEIQEAYTAAKSRLFLLDYDGTLAHIQLSPELAVPSEKLLSVLKKLTSDPKNRVIVISGRDRDFLELHLSQFKIDLIAEHGVWNKTKGNEWKTLGKLDNKWKPNIHNILQQFVDRTPGSLLEEKNYSLAWHYRKTDPGLAELRKAELIDELSQRIAPLNLQIMEGKKVIEVKNKEINKGTAASKVLVEDTFEFSIAIGDDHTDEDLFVCLPENGYSIKVGFGKSEAKASIETVDDVLELLDGLA